MKKSLTLKVLSLTLAIIMILSCGVAFAEETDKGNKEKGKDGELIQWIKGMETFPNWEDKLSDDEKALLDAYKEKTEEIKALKEALKTKREGNKALRVQVDARIDELMADADFVFTTEEIEQILGITKALRENMGKIKATQQQLRATHEQGKTARQNHDFEVMLACGDEIIDDLNTLIGYADVTTGLLNDLLAILN